MRVNLSKVPFAIIALAITLHIAVVYGCNRPPAKVAYDSLDGAVTTVQNAVRAYKEHCGVPPGQDGPGACKAAEYARAEDAYARFQSTAGHAVEIAAVTGETPLVVVSTATAEVLKLLAELGVK